jgi:photosystem II stability/assembly factor-like uncharacterized protein
MRLIVALLATCVAASACTKVAPPQTVSKPSASQLLGMDAPTGDGPIGRYVIVHSPHLERDTMLLDTATGQTWTLISVTDVKGNPLVWDRVRQMNTDEDWSNLIQKHGSTSNAARSANAALSPFGDHQDSK